MRKKYESPEFEILKIKLVDVIATSAPGLDDLIGGPGNEDDWWSDDFI